MKGVILSAGMGTRLQPFSYTQSKTLLPVANKPVLFYGIEHLINVGITEIGIVLHPSQKQDIKQRIGSGERFGATITYIDQSEPRGIAHALKQTEDFIDGDSFLMLLGDNLIQESLSSLKQVISEQQARSAIMLAKVDHPYDYGIAQIEGKRMVSLEEKPRNPKSNLAVIGAYAFDPVIFQAVHSISPSSRGEYEITDAIQWLIDHNYPISYSITTQHFSDVGTVPRWLRANKWWMAEYGSFPIDKSKNCVENCVLIPPLSLVKAVRLRTRSLVLMCPSLMALVSTTVPFKTALS